MTEDRGLGIYQIAVAVALKSQAFIKAMRLVPSQIRRQNQLVAAQYSATISGKSHHFLTDSNPTIFRSYDYSFHNA